MPVDRRNDHAAEWAEKILNDGVNLTAWEEEFTTSVDAQLARGNNLSTKQLDILELIYTEKTP